MLHGNICFSVWMVRATPDRLQNSQKAQVPRVFWYIKPDSSPEIIVNYARWNSSLPSDGNQDSVQIWFSVICGPGVTGRLPKPSAFSVSDYDGSFIMQSAKAAASKTKIIFFYSQHQCLMHILQSSSSRCKPSENDEQIVRFEVMPLVFSVINLAEKL